MHKKRLVLPRAGGIERSLFLLRLQYGATLEATRNIRVFRIYQRVAKSLVYIEHMFK